MLFTELTKVDKVAINPASHLINLSAIHHTAPLVNQILRDEVHGHLAIQAHHGHSVTDELSGHSTHGPNGTDVLDGNTGTESSSGHSVNGTPQGNSGAEH